MSRSRPLPLTSVADRVYEELKARIIDGKVAPGARLNIDALSRELGVSSTPVREALVRLAREHLVLLELYSGYSVAPPLTPDYIAGLIELRMLWEGHCALVGAPRRDPATLRAMERAFDRMASTRSLGTRYREYRRFTDEDARFHQALVDSAGNVAMTSVYAGLHILMLQSRLLLSRNVSGSPSEEVLGEHRAILDAYRRGDGEEASVAVRAHLAGGQRRLRTIVQAAADRTPVENHSAADRPARRGKRPRTLEGGDDRGTSSEPASSDLPLRRSASPRSPLSHHRAKSDI